MAKSLFILLVLSLFFTACKEEGSDTSKPETVEIEKRENSDEAPTQETSEAVKRGTISLGKKRREIKIENKYSKKEETKDAPAPVSTPLPTLTSKSLDQIQQIDTVTSDCQIKTKKVTTTDSHGNTRIVVEIDESAEGCPVLESKAITSIRTSTRTSVPRQSISTAQQYRNKTKSRFKFESDKDFELYFSDSLNEGQNNALGALLRNHRRQSDSGQTLMYFYEDLSTSPYMQNSELFEYVNVGVVAYRQLILKDACRWDDGSPCLMFVNNQLKVISTKEVLHRDEKYYVIYLNDLPSSTAQSFIKNNPRFLDVVNQSGKRVLVFSMVNK